MQEVVKRSGSRRRLLYHVEEKWLEVKHRWLDPRRPRSRVCDVQRLVPIQTFPRTIVNVDSGRAIVTIREEEY